MNNNLSMTTEQVKIYVSKYIIPQFNKGNESILRSLIFSLAEVNWEQVGKLIIHEHPELNQKMIDEQLVRK